MDLTDTIRGAMNIPSGDLRQGRALLAAALAPACAALLLAPGCAPGPAPPPPPVEVLVVPVVQQDVPIMGEWIGTLDGSVNAEIRPKVEGYLLRESYKEGQFVRRNDPLFEIDARQFKAALEQARGSLARAEAQLAKATKDVERFTPLGTRRSQRPTAPGALVRTWDRESPHSGRSAGGSFGSAAVPRLAYTAARRPRVPLGRRGHSPARPAGHERRGEHEHGHV
jgi:hypothetical protein